VRDYTKELRGVVDLTPIELAELKQMKVMIMGKEGDPKKKQEEFEWKARLLGAGIPHIYWDLELKQYHGDRKAEKIVLTYLEMMEDAFKEGQGILFLGEHGTGKTMLSCIIGKEALRRGYTVKYMGIPSILNEIMVGFGDNEVKERLATVVSRVELFIIDDLGKEYKGVGGKLDSMVNLELDRMLRARVNRGRVTIASTNYKVEQLKKSYGESIFSIIQGYVQFVEVEGVDYRQKEIGVKFRKKLEARV